jgi:hypothetical protein
MRCDQQGRCHLCSGEDSSRIALWNQRVSLSYRALHHPPTALLLLSGGVLLQFGFLRCSERQQTPWTVQREKKGEAENPSPLSPYRSLLALLPPTAMHTTASELLSL